MLKNINNRFIIINKTCFIMTYKNLEDKVKEFASSTASSVFKGYERLHSKHPRITNYLASAVGTVGGDAIAKPPRSWTR